MTQAFDTPGVPGSTSIDAPLLGGAAPPEAGVLPQDESTTEQVRNQAANVAGTATTQAANVAGTAAEQTKEVAGQAKQAAGEVASTAMEKAGEVQHEAAVQVRNLVSDTTQQVRTQAEAQTTKLAEGIGTLADQLRALVDGRPDEADAIRDYVQQGAVKLNAFSQRLQSQGLEGTIDEMQRYARRRPGVFLLGALGLGLGVGRFVRGAQAASSPATPAFAPTEVRGTLGVPGADGYEVPPTYDAPPLPVNVPLPPEVAAVSPLLSDDPTVPMRHDPLPPLPGSPATAPPPAGGGR